MDSIPEYSVRLSEEDRRNLENFDHALDYVISEDEYRFLEENGYLVLRGIIDVETIDQLVRESLEQISKAGVNIADSTTWQNIPYHGCFDIWHTSVYNELRQHPLLYSVFAQLLKTGNLTVSVDRINLKAPCLTPERAQIQAAENASLTLHTDVNYWYSNPNQPIYQGGLCLQDCPYGGGGFFCIPGFHRPERVRQYMEDVESGKFGDPRDKIPTKSKVFVTYLDHKDADRNKVEVPLNKGDFVIWNNNLPHNGGKNSLLVPPNRDPRSLENFRMHAYIMFMPLDGPCASEEVAAWYSTYQAETRQAILSGDRPRHFATRNRAPAGKVPLQKQKKVRLTSLGERLLGITPWYRDPE